MYFGRKRFPVPPFAYRSTPVTVLTTAFSFCWLCADKHHAARDYHQPKAFAGGVPRREDAGAGPVKERLQKRGSHHHRRDAAGLILASGMGCVCALLLLYAGLLCTPTPPIFRTLDPR